MPVVGSAVKPLMPFWATADGETVRLYRGEVRSVLRRLPEKSVQCVVTSPPYWTLRDYATASWKGGDPACDHKTYRGGRGDSSAKQVTNGGSQYYTTSPCPKCGAVCVDEQIGSEPTPEQYVETIVSVFREVRRVLRDDGTLWLNLGDNYTSGGGPRETGSSDSGVRRGDPPSGRAPRSLPAGNMVGIPWRVAFALQADGWILRQDIIWHKPNPMPESVRNRCTKAHEYVFLFSKRQNYFYDAEAIKEKSIQPWNSAKSTLAVGGKGNVKNRHLRETGQRITAGADTYHPDLDQNLSNKRSVWRIASEGYPGAHFATFPKRLIEPCVLAGTSEKGCCEQCGSPYRRVVESLGYTKADTDEKTGKGGPHRDQSADMNKTGGGVWQTKTVGWEPTCSCDAGVVPCVVLDPFVGSGTTCCVALGEGRHSVGIDLSEKYLRDNAIPRIEGELLSRPALAGLTGRAKVVEVGTKIG